MFRAMPDKDRCYSKAEPEVRRVIEACRAGRSPWPLYLHGTPGGGKTCAALSVADTCRWSMVYTMRQVCEKKNQALRGELYAKNPQAPHKVTEADMLEYLTKVDLLVLDELGARETASDPETDLLHQLLSAREGRPTILISNRPPSELGALYGAAVVSRILAGTSLEMNGPDRRLFA